MAKKKNTLTTSFGMPVADDQNTMTAGKQGPALVQDIHLIEKLAHFDRERIPERVVHAKGAGAYGYFEVSHDVTRYTRAGFLSEVGKRTEVFVRFSTVGGEKGSADSERDPRGFAVKFYTEEGNYDFVGNNTPVFFIRDPLKFPDFIHTQKRHPAKNTKDPDMFWDFLSLTPESIHQVTILFSDRGTPKSYRHMNGYSGHTFMWYNANGEYFWVKIHFKTEQKIQNLTREEAVRLAGEDPDQATRDLFDSIAKGDYPAWKVYVQVMTPDQVKKYRFDSFDITKVWAHGDVPLQPFGRMVLNRNPENYFADVEQSAFSPGNFVPGIGPSPDKMLQGRLFSYHDTHRHRLGPNYHLLPVNAPKAAPENSYQRDGFMRVDANGGGGPNYYPNTMGGPGPDPQVGAPPIDVSGMAARHAYTLSDDDFVQAGDLYRKVMTDQDRDHLIGNIVSHLGSAQKRIQLRQTALFYKADQEYGRRVAEGLKLDLAEVKRLAAMSQEDRVKATSA
ncbi:MAG: catalase [Candidatus Aminicenantes bacterium]|nr:MAG: catalase [Candidatus Aminicenantes bacterium]